MSDCSYCGNKAEFLVEISAWGEVDETPVCFWCAKEFEKDAKKDQYSDYKIYAIVDGE